MTDLKPNLKPQAFHLRQGCGGQAMHAFKLEFRRALINLTP